MVRRGLRLILEESRQVEVVAEAGDGQELVDLVDRFSPDVVVVDVQMPKLDGLEAVRRIRDRHPNVRSLVFTVHDEEATVHRAVLAGASGYLLKTYISLIFTKMGAADRTDAVALALRKGLVQYLYSRRPLLRSVRRPRGDSQLVASLRSAAATPPWTPLSFAPLYTGGSGLRTFNSAAT